MNANVLTYLDENAKRLPEKTAIWDDGIEVSYKEYRDKALAVAEEIIKLGISKQPIVVYIEKSAKVLISFAAVAYSRNFYSPIDVEMPESRVLKIFETLNPALVITTKELKDRLSGFGYDGKVLIYDETGDLPEDEESVTKVQAKIIDTDLLYVLFTSGSTGVPKGVGITHRGVIDYADAHVELFDYNENDNIGNQAQFYFDLSVGDIYPAMKSGAQLTIIPHGLFGRPVKLLDFIKERNINTIYWVPSALMIVSRLKAFRNVDVSNVIKKVLFCGEVMQSKQLNVWKSYIPDALYCNLYGPTEATVASTYFIVNREIDDSESLPIGEAMPNSDILILDENDKEIAVSDTESVGELCIRGTGVTVGYYANEEKTKEALVQNPLVSAYEEKIYRTGDLVRYNSRGELTYVCRKDFQVKHMGHRIELGEIETAYSSIEDMPVGCVLYDEKHSKIVLITEGEIDKETVNQKLENMVPEYMVPNKYVSVEKMPMNVNGKIDRVKLKEIL